MGKEWKVRCKSCGKPVGYSDYSYQSMRDFGHSRPEYCDECRETHQNEKQTMGVSYFHAVPKEGASISDIKPGPLGKIYHPARPHQASEQPSRFDASNFGVTPEKIREVYEWFLDPKHRVVVVVGPTGSGKSTALPYWLIEPPEDSGVPHDFFTRDGQILLTEPRIDAVEGIAEYIGKVLVGGSVGKGLDIGYRHSKDRNYDWRNRMFPATDGSLINWIQEGRLSSFSTIVIDEAHERSLNIDTTLKLLKEQLPLYPHLKIIIASATINAQMFANYFGPDTAKIVEVAGKDMEYQKVFAPEEEKLPYQNLSRMRDRIVPATVDKVMWLLGEMVEGKRKDKSGEVLRGDILVFLHGVDPIENAAGQIRARARKDQRLAKITDVYTLYGDLPQKEKDFIREAGDPSRIRVIVSTNVAEASLTVEGVVFVIDSGLEYQPQQDSKVPQATRIEMITISKANAKQRWGRSGRTQNGEVHCLYTKEQFQDLMPEYPTPAIQRVPLETVILNAKAAGVEDVTSDWIQDPQQEEVQRATRVLKEKGALNQEGTITEYGNRLRYFSYPAALADLIMLADRWGCVIEVATLLPVIKSRGERYFLAWDYDWEAERKKRVGNVHRALMAGCHDDLELILKIYSLWSQPPGAEELEGEELETARREWARAHYLRVEVLERIEQEREELLRSLYGRRRETEYRPIDFGLVDRVRVLLAHRLENDQERLITEPGSDYKFDPTQKPKPGSVATYRSLFLPEWNGEGKLDKLRAGEFSPLALGKWISGVEKTSREEARNKHIRSRLFIDQKYPLGTGLECQITRKEDGSLGIRLLGPAREGRREGTSYSPQEVFPEAEGRIRITGEELEPGEHFTVEVQEYEFDQNFRPVVLLEIVPEVAPLSTFINTHQEGDQLKVKVKGHTDYVGDSEVALILEEAESGTELLLEPKNLGATYTSSMAQRIPVGAKFPVTVRDIDKENQRVEVSCLKRSQQALNLKFQENTPNADGYKVAGEVVDVWENGQVFFLLDWSMPQEGILQAVRVAGRGLCKPAEQFQLGERYQLHITPKRMRPAKAKLSSLPQAVQSYLETGEEQNLTWSQGRLEFEGRMAFQQFLKYKRLDSLPQYQEALESLFRFSNQLWVTKMVDLSWLKRISEKYPPGALVTEAEIKEKHKSGMVVKIEEDVEGFVPQSRIFEPDKQLEVGSRITAQVLNIDPERRNLVLNMKIEENVPRELYQENYERFRRVGRKILRMAKRHPREAREEVKKTHQELEGVQMSADQFQDIRDLLDKGWEKAEEQDHRNWVRRKKGHLKRWRSTLAKNRELIAKLEREIAECREMEASAATSKFARKVRGWIKEKQRKIRNIRATSRKTREKIRSVERELGR